MTPQYPDVDLAELRQRPLLERHRVLAEAWSDHGLGTPWGIHFVYLAKAVGYLLGGAAIIGATTPGLGGLGDVASWWTEPIVLQKLVVYTLLFEVLGLGCGFGPLTFRFVPPVTAALHWLRPGTVRLPPWPDRVPFTTGHRRSVLDVLLYAALLGTGVWLLVDPGLAADGGTAARVDPALVVPFAVLLPLLSLRDKVVFVAARGEHFWIMTLLLLLPPDQFIGASKWIFVLLWWGAATSKLNGHFPAVIATMISNAPGRPRWMRHAVFRDAPRDLRPSGVAGALAHVTKVIEYGLPVLLLVAGDHPLRWVPIAILVVFHLNILSTIAMGAPNEWNVFFIVGSVWFFGVHGGVSPLDIAPWAAALLLGSGAVAVLGNLRPDLVSFLPAMRYYAGNWPATFWLLRPGCEQRIADELPTAGPSTLDQLRLLYDEDEAQLLLEKARVWRTLHLQGRALLGLAHRAVDDIEQYDVREGEPIAGLVLGWNFGDGHLVDDRLLAAIQERCDFAPGDVRVVLLEGQPLGTPHSAYRIVDLATGDVERGTVAVADMRDRQPWLDGDPSFPVEVEWSATAAGAAT